MPTLEGMLFYEFVLLVLGALLFLTLLVILVILVVQRRAIKTLLAFFLLPVLMIGFPAYSKISYENGVVSLEKDVRRLENGTATAEEQQKLREDIAAVEERASNDPERMLLLGRAYAVMGDTLRGLAFAEEAQRMAPALPEAESVVTRLRAPVIRLQERVAALPPVRPGTTDPQHTDTTSAQPAVSPDLVRELDAVRQSGSHSTSTRIVLAQGYLAAGRTEDARQVVDSILQRDPENAAARRIRRDLLRR